MRKSRTLLACVISLVTIAWMLSVASAQRRPGGKAQVPAVATQPTGKLAFGERRRATSVAPGCVPQRNSSPESPIPTAP